MVRSEFSSRREQESARTSNFKSCSIRYSQGMTTDERLDGLTGIVESLAAGVVARDDQIEAHTRQIGAHREGGDPPEADGQPREAMTGVFPPVARN